MDEIWGQKWPIFGFFSFLAHFWVLRPQKRVKNDPKMVIFLGYPPSAAFLAEKIPQKGVKKPLFWGYFGGTPPQILGGGGCGNAKMPKIGVGKMRHFSEKWHFWLKNVIFSIFGPFLTLFWPPKKGGQKRVKNDPKMWGHFLAHFWDHFFVKKKFYKKKI